MKPRVVSVGVFVPSPRPGTMVVGGSYYTRPTGTDLMSVHVYSSQSDMMDVEYYRLSADNGRSWAAAAEVTARRQTPKGVLRRHARYGYLDARTGRYLRMRNEAVLPTDAVMEYMTHNTMHYEVSADGGRSFLCDEPVVQSGAGFDEDHPLPGVRRGKNCYMIGDFACSAATAGDGTILVPCQIAPTGPDGAYLNKGSGFTYTDAALIKGTWRPDGRLDWRLAGRLEGDPARSTRGLIEPTVAELDPGRLLMVMRGSNDKRPELPGYRWHTVSRDGGESWPAAEPWRFTDGEPFNSPSSCSQLLAHSTGGLFWLGNLCAENPKGNLPRFPFVIAEVERSSGLVVRDSLATVDDRRPDDPEFTTLSNFSAREDRETGHVVLHLARSSRPTEAEAAAGKRFQGDCLRVEIAVD